MRKKNRVFLLLLICVLFLGALPVSAAAGHYVAGVWGSWSAWATTNNRSVTAIDPNTYRGETVTEYQVQTRTEYKFTRSYTKYNYDTMYYTVYVGTSLSTLGKTLTLNRWGSYYGSISEYTIVSRYTKQVAVSSYTMTETSDWRTTAPALGNVNVQWSHTQKRTTYRYRTRVWTWRT